MLHMLNIATSTLASSLRSWRGTSASRTVKQPAGDLILYDREGDGDCRMVREALSELNLNVMIKPCPVGGLRFASELIALSGSDQVPFLVDGNSGEKIAGAEAIIEYLYLNYRKKQAPKHFRDSLFNRLSSQLASQIRLNAGQQARKARPAKELLTLYSFESSPFSRLVRERLCELELPYQLINLGKQQWADMGPAKFHFTLKPYKPLPNTKRSDFFDQHGNVQVPFLVDPNHDQALFESGRILAYLEKTYAI